MIDALHHHLSAAWKRAARSLDTHRRHFLTFGAAAGAALALPVVVKAAPSVCRPAAARARGLGYQETAHVRHYYTTTRL
jgi:hypothetical protein